MLDGAERGLTKVKRRGRKTKGDSKKEERGYCSPVTLQLWQILLIVLHQREEHERLEFCLH